MKWIDEAIVVVASSSNVSPCLFVKIPHSVVLVLGIIKRVNRKLIRFMLQCHGTKIKICRKMNTKEIKNWIEIKKKRRQCAHTLVHRKDALLSIFKSNVQWSLSTSCLVYGQLLNGKHFKMWLQKNVATLKKLFIHEFFPLISAESRSLLLIKIFYEK